MIDLTVLFVTLPFVFAALAAILLCLLTFVCFRSPTAGMVLVAVLFLTEATLPALPPIYLGIQVYLPDIFTVFLGAVALLRFLTVADRPQIPRSWLVFLVAIGISFVVGFSRFSVTAGTALRPYFYPIAVASYLMTFDASEAVVRRLFAMLGWCTVALLALVFARWIITAVPIPALLPPGGRFASSEASVLRVNSSEEAIVLAQMLVVMLFFPQSSPTLRRLRVLVPILFIVVILLQHRSVWLAAFVGVAARFMLPAAGRRATTQIAALILASVVIAIPMVLSGRLGSAASDVAESANRAATLSDTSQVRLESWKFVITKWREGGPRSIAIGQPFGTSMDRYILGSNRESLKVTFSSHNFYVQTLFNTGLLGLGAYMFLSLWLLLQLYRLARDPEHMQIASALFLLMIVQLAYYVPYSIHHVQGLVLGGAVAYVQTLRRRGVVIAGAPRREARAPVLPPARPWMIGVR